MIKNLDQQLNIIDAVYADVIILNFVNKTNQRNHYMPLYQQSLK